MLRSIVHSYVSVPGFGALGAHATCHGPLGQPGYHAVNRTSATGGLESLLG